ncbi:uncharacterized protein [Mobula birostris]|uniref:uncharacterized protein isoform X3 n=1 Tax=Mobula birostris TaxID=1983395 RepID=UPI003B2885A4
MLKTGASHLTGADSKCTALGTGKIECEKIISEELRAVPLHYCPELVEACADLINEEWKRSKASRIHSLLKSSSSFPVCLVLKKIPNDIGNTNSENRSQLVGHSRLSRVVGKSSGLFVETVVVAKEFRGKGYGRKLMEATEAYAKNRGFKTLYLTTHDKQDFYSHLGYVLTEPVQNAGSMTTFMNMEFLKKLSLPSVSTPINSHLLLPPAPSPQVPFPTPQLPTAPVSEPAQQNRQSHSSSFHPLKPFQSHVSVTLPSSFTALSSQSGQLQISVPCSSNISQLDECVPIPPPPPLPPPLPSAHPGLPSLIMSQLHGQTHPCNSSPLSPTLPISQMSQLHTSSTLHLQLAPSPADSVVMFPTPPPLPSASETLTKLAQFPYHSPKFSKENEKATQNPLETPYRCAKGLPVFWMKKGI